MSSDERLDVRDWIIRIGGAVLSLVLGAVVMLYVDAERDEEKDLEAALACCSRTHDRLYELERAIDRLVDANDQQDSRLDRGESLAGSAFRTMNQLAPGCVDYARLESEATANQRKGLP